jgi:nucleotide-binding universal stress UspA family protein
MLVVPKRVELKFVRILVASDGSPHSYAAWDEGLCLTQRVGSELLALSGARDDSELETAQAIVQRLATGAKLRGLTLITLVRQGRPYEAIVQAAREMTADVIVMGALGMTGLTSLLVGRASPSGSSPPPPAPSWWSSG